MELFWGKIPFSYTLTAKYNILKQIIQKDKRNEVDATNHT